MISKTSPAEEGGFIEDKCRYCGEHLGYVMPGFESIALWCCDKPECLNKKRQESHKNKITGGGPDVGS